MREEYEALTGVGAGILDDYQGFAPASEEDWI